MPVASAKVSKRATSSAVRAMSAAAAGWPVRNGRSAHPAPAPCRTRNGCRCGVPKSQSGLCSQNRIATPSTLWCAVGVGAGVHRPFLLQADAGLVQPASRPAATLGDAVGPLIQRGQTTCERVPHRALLCAGVVPVAQLFRRPREGADRRFGHGVPAAVPDGAGQRDVSRRTYGGRSLRRARVQLSAAFQPRL